jgi:hypothetical protein
VDKTTGDIKIQTTSNDFNFLGHYNRYMQLKDSETFCSNPEVIEIQDFDYRIAVFDDVKKQIIVKYYKNNLMNKIRKFRFDQTTIDTDALVIYLQGMLLNNSGSFNFNILLKSKGLRLNANFKLQKTVDLKIISNRSSFPEIFNDVLSNNEEFMVYKMSFTGIFKVLYPYKFYFVYKQNPLGDLVVYWGGAFLDEEYFSFNKLE